MSDKEKFAIDFQALQMINKFPGLNTGEGSTTTTPDAHEFFMQNYQKLLIKPHKAIELPPRHLENRILAKHTDSTLVEAPSSLLPKEDVVSTKSYAAPRKVCPPSNPPVTAMSHNIADHTQKLHKKKAYKEAFLTLQGSVDILKTILKKQPYQRTKVDNDQIAKALKSLDCITSRTSSADHLREISVIAHMELIEEAGVSVFGHNALHVVLSGSIKQQTASTVKFQDDILGVGSCFGSLQFHEMPIQEVERMPYLAVTCTPCILMTIPANHFTRIVEQLERRDFTEKINVLQQNPEYKLWTRQSLVKMCNLMKRQKIAPNTVMLAEDFVAPLVCYVIQGSCLIMRKLLAKKKLKSGQDMDKRVQVVMGHLGVGSSFGELSVLNKTPALCTILSVETVEVYSIEPDLLYTLDEDTQQLLRQSSVETGVKITKEDIELEYVKQQSQAEWTQFKKDAVMETIQERGIRPGLGKWAKE